MATGIGGLDMDAVRAQSGDGPATSGETDYIALVDAEEIEPGNAAKEPLPVPEVHGSGAEGKVTKQHALLGQFPETVGGAILVLVAVALAEPFGGEFGENQFDGGAVEMWEGGEIVGEVLNTSEGALALFEN